MKESVKMKMRFEGVDTTPGSMDTTPGSVDITPIVNHGTRVVSMASDGRNLMVQLSQALDMLRKEKATV